jgi:hypothetical protein
MEKDFSLKGKRILLLCTLFGYDKYSKKTEQMCSVFFMIKSRYYTVEKRKKSNLSFIMQSKRSSQKDIVRESKCDLTLSFRMRNSKDTMISLSRVFPTKFVLF